MSETPRTNAGEPRVVVVGGGYAGAVAARALDSVADVTLVEPKDKFVHAAGTLRAVVEENWEDNVFHSYDSLLTRGRIIHDAARLVTPHKVHMSASAAIAADYIILATGTAYPFPAKFIETDAWVVQARLARLRKTMSNCSSIMLVGAGPVGLELAGELTSAFPEIGVTIVDSAPDILTTGDYLPELRDSLRTQLEARGVRFVLGAPLGYLPPDDVGVYERFTVHTTAGEQIDGDMWFRCYGNQQESSYLDAELTRARRSDGAMAVTPTLQVKGFDNVFAIGDLTNVPESKRANAAMDHAEVAATNLKDIIAGRAPSLTYEPAPELVVLPLGPDGGASQLMNDGVRSVLGQEETIRFKGLDLMTEPIREMLGLQ